MKAANKSRNKSKFIKPILFAVMVGALSVMLFGSLSGDQFTYLAFLLVFVTLLPPQLGDSLKYKELINILEKKLPQNETIKDVLSQELRKHNKKLIRNM